MSQKVLSYYLVTRWHAGTIIWLELIVATRGSLEILLDDPTLKTRRTSWLLVGMIVLRPRFALIKMYRRLDSNCYSVLSFYARNASERSPLFSDQRALGAVI